MKECILEPSKNCIQCGRCNLCDLDETKICDNCCRCMGEADFRGIEITEMIVPKELKIKKKKSSSTRR